MREHTYILEVIWTGNQGQGTETYNGYLRNHQIIGLNKPPIHASSDPIFRGDGSKYNPEELFLGSISSCHMLWYLHICSQQGISVLSYQDFPEGKMEENEKGGRFTAVNLNPVILISNKSEIIQAERLHEIAHKYCFIANSCNFPIRCNPKISGL
jgi:organic hydroperoxide reductase OsmC/OhrA